MQNIKTLAVLLALATNVLAAQPNIFLIMADDMNWRDCSPYYGQPGGHPTGAMPGDLTPNIQTLANQGLRFDRCVNATAMCSPYRMSLYTGIYAVRNGAYPNHSNVKAGTKSIVHYLSALGYRVGLMGKLDVRPTASFPFEIIGNDNGDSTENAANIALAEAFLNRNTNQPYCLLITSHSPHGPWDHGDYVTNNLELPVTPDYLDTPEYRTSFNQYLKEVNVFDSEVGHWLNAVNNGPNPDNTIFIFLSEQGSSLPGGKWNCYDLGTHTGCIIRWPGHVAPGTSTGALIELIDLLPTLIEAAGGAQPTGLARLDGLSFLPVLEGKRDYHKQYACSLQTTKGAIGAPNGGYAMRTICDTRYKLIWNPQYTTIYNSEGVAGQPFLSWQAVAADTNAAPATRAQAQSLVDRLLTRPPYQFFDTQNDPFQLTNLIAEPQHASRIADMKAKLVVWMSWQRDKGILTEQAAVTQTTGVADEVPPYEAWANRYPFVWQADRTPTADPDGDGDDNFTEWLKNTDPFAATTNPGIRILETASFSDGTNQMVDLAFERSTHYAGSGQTFASDASDALASNGWNSVPGTIVDFPTFATDPLMERATLRVVESNAPPSRFYRLRASALADYAGAPTNFLSGTASSVDLGPTQPALNSRDLSLTIRTQLPVAPLASNKAQALWKFGGSKGISLVLMGDQLVFSGSTSSTAAGALNLSAMIEPADFGKTITIRLTLDHKVSSTDFQLSYVVDGGSASATTVAMQQFVGYIGTANGGIGQSGGTITGISGTPFGLLAALPNGTADVSPWASGAIRYEIIGTVAAPLQ